MHQKSGKASFGHIYDLEDPREYYSTLGGMDYRAPEYGQRLFSKLVEKRSNGNGPVNVVDLCCSYGINAALLKYDVALDDLYDRYSSDNLLLSGDELAESDAAYYADREKEDAPRVVGVDAAGNAVSYALKAGLLDAGAGEDLENEPPSEALRREVSGADLFTVTGGIGYISERTFDRLLGCVDEGRDPWVAVLALRWVSYDKISEVLGGYGLVTEKLEGHTFEQRRFADEEEQEYVCGELESMGIDTEGKEGDGSYHAEFYLSRPEEQASEASVGELVGLG
ncbi:class I SAM-dependent methyltransferase [soil metagenome]